MKSIRTSIAYWSKTYSDRAKLQHGYAVLAILSLIVAGIIGLINYNLGQSLLFVAIAALLVFIANGVVWALINTFVVPLASNRPRPTKK